MVLMTKGLPGYLYYICIPFLFDNKTFEILLSSLSLFLFLTILLYLYKFLLSERRASMVSIESIHVAYELHQKGEDRTKCKQFFTPAMLKKVV